MSVQPDQLESEHGLLINLLKSIINVSVVLSCLFYFLQGIICACPNAADYEKIYCKLCMFIRLETNGNMCCLVILVSYILFYY